MKFKISSSQCFLIIMLVLYFVLFIISQTLFYSTLSFFGEIILEIIPIILIVFVLMVLTNYFITPEFILKHIREKGIRKWFYVIIGGILSAGPIYLWYPLLADLKHKGLSHGLIACFLYNRAIKLPLLPLAILYFGWKYVLVLGFVMIIMSVIQGILIDKVMEIK